MFRFSIRELMLLTLVCVVCGCSWGGSQIRQGKSKAKPTAGLILSERASEARDQILKEIPLGIAMNTAVIRLSSLGFTTSNDSPDERIMRLKRGRNLVDVVWIVKMRGEGGKLVDVTTEVAYIGP